MSLLKEAGNAALKASLPHLAARRYGKAINYCSVAYLKFPVGTVQFLSEHQRKLSNNGGYECCWTALLQTLIMLRLNLAMVFLTSVSLVHPNRSHNIVHGRTFNGIAIFRRLMMQKAR